MHKVLITTVPFGSEDQKPINLLQRKDVDFLINPLGRKLAEEDLLDLAPNFDIIIAGTEPITSRVMRASESLKMIARVGVGLDSVDLKAAKQRGVVVTYTPEAPAPAVADLALGSIITLLRCANLANAEMKQGKWHRFFGRRLECSTVGVIGIGRIGRRLVDLLQRLGTKRILVHDVNFDQILCEKLNLEQVSLDQLLIESDVVSIHVPLTKDTLNMIDTPQLNMMKKDAVLVNTARGGVVNESALYEVMKSGQLLSSAIDVFEEEPYEGVLSSLANCFLTSHMGSMSIDCRVRMEVEATEEVIRFIDGKKLRNEVPASEYNMIFSGE